MSQLTKLSDVMSDYFPHRSDELLEKVYGGSHLGIARLGARIYDLKQTLPPRVTIVSWRDKEKPTLTWYQMKVEVDTDMFGAVG